jgi:acyl-CoA synthetase (AMP-forming)/AMP-acid ligase II
MTPMPPLHSLNAYVAHRAAVSPEATAYAFLHDPDTPGKAERISYLHLATRVRRFAAALRASAAPGARALLLYQPGIDYIVALYACLWAGMISVPAYPMRNNRHGRRIARILDDCGAELVLAARADWPRIQACLEPTARHGRKPAMLSEPDEDSAPIALSPVDTEIAFLQYTSGSTGDPKGVMVTHRNLLHNLRQIERKFGNTSDSVMVSWLPPYHDMGLVSAILQPLFVGFPVYLMSPFAFLQKPARWLRCISDCRATVSGGPNFSFDLCVEKVGDERAGLDLRSLRVMYNGAEPVSPATLARFHASFAPCGYEPRMSYPCYGLAESTLFVTGGHAAAAPVVVHDAQGRALAGVGTSIDGQEVVIADPVSMTCLADGEEGEILVRGPSVAKGYWGKTPRRGDAFDTYTADGNGPYLRTGDLGRLVDGELTVTGRIKDLIVIRGDKYYPQDIEQAIAEAIPALRKSCAAAFQYEADEACKIAFVAEIERHARRTAPELLLAQIKAVARSQFQLSLDAVVIVQPGTACKTSSGKIQRTQTRHAFLDKKLAIWAAS